MISEDILLVHRICNNKLYNKNIKQQSKKYSLPYNDFDSLKLGRFGFLDVELIILSVNKSITRRFYLISKSYVVKSYAIGSYSHL